MSKANSGMARQPVLTTPKGTDPDWQQKVDLARAAREMAQRLRDGKPTSFRRAMGRVTR